jgi:hypothetical protein
LLENAFATAKANGEKFQKEEQSYEGKRIILISHTKGMKDEAGTSGKAAVPTTPPVSPPLLGEGFGPSKDAKESNRPPLEVLEGAPSVKVRGRDALAIGVLDNNTLAIGELESVRAAIDASLGRERVDDELVRLATQTPGAVVGFSGKIPQGLSRKASPNTSIEKYFASIRQFYGSFNANGTDAETAVTLRTETAEQASEIGQALNAIKSFSALSGLASGGNAAKANSIADLIKGLSITTQGNEVQINVKVPQGSFAPLVRTF